MEIKKDDINRKLFGYKTTEEMEASIKAHVKVYERRKKWENSHKRQLKEERIRNALIRGDEDGALEEYLEMEFGE